MSFGLRNLGLPLGVAVVMSSVLLLPTARGQEKAKQQASPEAVKGNSAVKVERRDRLMRLEEELSGMLGFLKPENEAQPLPPPMHPPAAPAVRNRRLKEIEERQRNWMLLNPNDRSSLPTIEEIMGTPELMPDKASSKPDFLLQPFSDGLRYQRKNKPGVKKPGQEDLAGRKGSGLRVDDGVPEDEDLPAGLKAADQEIKKQIKSSPATTQANVFGRSMFSDIFGLGNPGMTPEEETAHKAMVRQFQQILDGPQAAGGNTMLDALNARMPGALPSATARPLSGFDVPKHPPGFDSQLGVVNPALAAGVLQDPTTKALNAWNPYYTPPQAQPAPTPPPQPIFTVPRRRF